MTTWLINSYIEQRYKNIIESCLISKEMFSTFRSHQDYMAIISEAMPMDEIKIYYNELLKRPKILQKFDIIKQMDKIGSPILNPTIQTAPRNLRYMYNTSRIEEYFGDIKNVVEIGVGYGGLCFTMGQYFSLTGYKLIDIDCVIKLTKLFLSNLPSIHNNIKEEDFFNSEPPYDICISECALTELDFESILYYYDLYLSKSKYLFIRTNFQQQSDFNLFLSILKKDFDINFTYDFPDPNAVSTVILGYNRND